MCTENQLAETIDTAGKNGQSLDVSLQRGDQVLSLSLSPLRCPETGRYRIGLFVRDSCSGIGTLSFYDPTSRVYGAIGHRITDSDTLQPIDSEEGNVVLASIQAIQPGRIGRPCEKIGIYANGDTILGDVQKNTQFGIYGQLSFLSPNDLYLKAIPVASRMQIQIGPAEILTVIEGTTVERFTIEIEKVNPQDYPANKGVVIKVTDPRLLTKTGGIVQGMSGSPIIQNGRLIGAVTHVFISDPSKGYGCFADWMLMESGLIFKTENWFLQCRSCGPAPKSKCIHYSDGEFYALSL
ncbi:MAG: stage sporulation protein [Caproiciproducens sp.]|nr:stage sporulation protein [Caproiciproducens sp.]